MNDEDTNLIIELDSNNEESLFEEEKENEITKIEDDIIKVEKKSTKIKKKKENFYKRLSKKGKIIFWIIIVFIVLLTAGLIYYFLFYNKKETPEVVENIVLEKDNYRYNNGKLELLNNKNKVIGTYDCNKKDVEKCYIAYLTDEDDFYSPEYIDEKGDQLKRISKVYGNRFVFIYDNDEIVLYDLKKSKSMKKYQSIKTGETAENLIVVKDKENKYGILKISSSYVETILKNEYEYLGIINSNDKFVAKNESGYFLIDSAGEAISSIISKPIKTFDEKYIVAGSESVSLYDYHGTRAIEETFDYIDLENGYVFAILESKMFVYNSSLEKLNIAGIKIKANQYNPKYIFDEKGNLKNSEKAYDLSFDSSNITVTVNEKENKINLKEIAINKKYKYVSYLDGTLYFYEDEDKENLIGQYKCVNKNEVTSENDNYSNCFIATETNIINSVENPGYAPIFNGKYVFIYDVKADASKPNIILYDFVNNKNKAKYQEIDSGISYSEITHISSINSVIYAKNSDGNYGAITFGTDGPKGLIAFRDSNDNSATISISKLEDYLLVKRGAKYYLYDKLGTELASSEFEIVELNGDYLLVKNDNKYLVYNNKEGKILSNEFDYIKLYDTYFVGIKSKKLNVYNYSDGKKGLLKEDLEIISKELNKSFEIACSEKCTVNIIKDSNSKFPHEYNLDWSDIKVEAPEKEETNEE